MCLKILFEISLLKVVLTLKMVGCTVDAQWMRSGCVVEAKKDRCANDATPKFAQEILLTSTCKNSA
jgi:hypothetical protein